MTTGSMAPMQFQFANNYSDTSGNRPCNQVPDFISDILEAFFLLTTE